jgi:cbb3-type cytochrome oxidase cytochrome c subunit
LPRDQWARRRHGSGSDLGRKLGTVIGNKAKPEWLRAWIHNPRVYDPGSQMPHYRFSDQQFATMEGFLLAKSDSDFLANVHLDPATPEQIAHGKSLVMVVPVISWQEEQPWGVNIRPF